MMLNGFTPAARRPVLLAAGTVVDSDGDTVESWDVPLRFALPTGTSYQDRNSVEVDSKDRRITTSQRVLYVPGPDVLTEDNRVEIDGEQWRIEGEPAVKRRGDVPVYTSALLKRVTAG